MRLSTAQDLLSVVAAPPVGPRYLAYWIETDSGENWIAGYLDASGVVTDWIGDLGDPTGVSKVSAISPIQDDASGLVSAGSLIAVRNDLYVLDLASGQLYSRPHDPQTYWIGAAYFDGHVYALLDFQSESSATSKIELHRLSTDLSSGSVVATVDLAPDWGNATNDPEFPLHAGFFGPKSIAFSSTAAWVTSYWAYGDGVNGLQAAVLNYDGSVTQAPAPSNSSVGPDYDDPGPGLPYLANGAIRGRWHWEGGFGTAPGDEAWTEWASGAGAIGELGGPGQTATSCVYHRDVFGGSLLSEGTADTGASGQFLVPFATHPEHGPIGPPSQIFMAL